MKKQKPENTIIFDGTVSVPEIVHTEYIAYGNTIDIASYAYKSVLKESTTALFDPETPQEIKKKLIFLLGQFATIECYTLLNKYIEIPNESLIPWATLAMQDLRFKIENDMHDDGRDMVMSPSGGKGDKIRYFTVFASTKGKPIAEHQKQIIKEGILLSMTRYHGELEAISFGSNYCLATLLILLTVAPQTSIEAILDIASKKKHILKYHVMITNVQPFTQKEITDYLVSKELVDL